MKVEDRVAALLAAWTGIELSDSSMPTLSAFLHERARELGFGSPHAYAAAIGGPENDEFQRLVNAMTVTYTWFFRDLEQVETLRELIRNSAQPSLDIWVPGCSSGEDAYTIALLCRELGVTAQILGTDVNSAAVARAREGRYGQWSIRDVPSPLREHFVRSPRGGFEIDERIRSRVRFSVHNLLSPAPFPPGGGWDLVLCRNVLMYFGKDRAKDTVGVLGRVLHEHGRLLLGASDVMVEVPRELRVEYVGGRVTYRKPSATDALEIRPTPRAQPLPIPETRTGNAGIANKEPEARPTLLDAAHAHLMGGQVDLALRDYLRLSEADPVAVEPRLFAGVSRYLLGDVERALEAFRACLLLDEHCWPASYYLGLCYENLGLAQDAMREYRRAASESASNSGTNEGDPRSPLHGFLRDMAWLAKKRSASGLDAR